MNDANVNSSLRGPGHARRRRGIGFVAVPALASALLLAACGSGPSVPGVAGSGSTTTTTSPGPATPGSRSGALAELLKYSKCMRSHGVPDFPDPTVGTGGQISLKITAGRGSALGPQSPEFKAAESVCKSLRPGGNVSPAQVAQQVAGGVKLASCMRAHGFPSFPDPDSHDVFDLPSSMDTTSSTWQATFSGCEKTTGVHGGNFSQGSGGPGASTGAK
jgi:hypothetical protein